MVKFRGLVPVLIFGLASALASAADLSRYRDFQFGADLASTARQAAMSPSQAEDVHRRPALIQEMRWRPQRLGRSFEADSVEDVLFTFYDGQLFRMEIRYGRTETEGLSADDLVQAISAVYGPAENIAAPAKTGPAHYGEQEVVVARWQDTDYRFDLLSLSYGPSFKLVGVVKKLESPARAAIVEATRLDDQEAPAREAARLAGAEQEAKTKLDKVRLVNKPKFRP